MGKRTCLKLACIMLLLLSVLSGCGKEEESPFGIDGYVYTAQQIGTGGGAADRFRLKNGYIYYRVWESRDVRRFSIEELLAVDEEQSMEGDQAGDLPSLPAGRSVLSPSDGSRGYIRDYAVDEDGCVYCAMQLNEAGEEPSLRPVEGTNGYGVDPGETSYVLTRQLADGSQGYRVALPDLPKAVAVDNEERAYVLIDDYVFIVDSEGRQLDQLSVGEGMMPELLEGEPGTVYYQPYTFCNMVQKIVADGQSGSFRAEQLIGPCSRGQFGSSGQGLFYTGDDGILYHYREEDGSWETVLRWGDSDLACYSGFAVFSLSEDRMAADLRVVGESGIYENVLYVLTKTPVEELPEKEVLVMAIDGTMLDRVKQLVMDFNRSSADYHITLQLCEDPTRLDAELVSSNPPDLIDLTYLDYVKYGQKDALEDLAPYLETSTVLDREQFRQSVLDSCTVKGRLVCIPDEIFCTTVFGRTSQVGGQAGWSVEEAMALAESHPQARLFINNSFSAMIREFFRDYILERYIDWENGECSFDGEEFIAFIKWTAEHSDGADNEEGPIEIRWGNMPKERLLDITAGVNGVDIFMLHSSYFGEDVTAIGYPTAGGEASHRGRGINQLGIAAASDKKEGAWQFIEFFLSRENGNYTFLPARRDRMEEEVAKLVEADMAIYLPDATKESYRSITREDMEKVYAILDQANYTPRLGIREDIIDIIIEEMTPCLSGAKSYEEAAAIVQNRVRNMVRE